MARQGQAGFDGSSSRPLSRARSCNAVPKWNTRRVRELPLSLSLRLVKPGRTLLQKPPERSWAAHLIQSVSQSPARCACRCLRKPVDRVLVRLVFGVRWPAADGRLQDPRASPVQPLHFQWFPPVEGCAVSEQLSGHLGYGSACPIELRPGRASDPKAGHQPIRFRQVEFPAERVLGSFLVNQHGHRPA
jgi:hypothetical protein